MTDNLPHWVWDVLADLIDHENVHENSNYGDKAGVCLASTLERVPVAVRSAGEVIAQYRGQVQPSPPPRPWPGGCAVADTCVMDEACPLRPGCARAEGAR